MKRYMLCIMLLCNAVQIFNHTETSEVSIVGLGYKEADKIFNALNKLSDKFELNYKIDASDGKYLQPYITQDLQMLTNLTKNFESLKCVANNIDAAIKENNGIEFRKAEAELKALLRPTFRNRPRQVQQGYMTMMMSTIRESMASFYNWLFPSQKAQ